MILMYPSSSIVAKSLQEKHNHDNVLEILPAPATSNNNNIIIIGVTLAMGKWRLKQLLVCDRFFWGEIASGKFPWIPQWNAILASFNVLVP